MINLAENLSLDLTKLIDTRLLIQANSGGGKSHILRLIAEQSIGQVQTIILDPEGEFPTLRERHDLLIVGGEGEIVADVRAAGLLARKLCELGCSAVVDLYDLQKSQRRRFVRLFLESLMSVPRALWHPMVVAIDEAHEFGPEKSAGEAESLPAVISLMSQGRKRGVCGLLATQRLSKLHKDAAAEANNIFVGRTALDVDQIRAGDLLGFSKASRMALRDLRPGQFYAFGPALTDRGVVCFQADRATTTHPEAGGRHLVTPPRASDAITAIVRHFSDLPAQAEEEARNLEDARRRIAELDREMKGKSRATQIDQGAIDRAVAQAEQRCAKSYGDAERTYQAEIQALRRRLDQIRSLTEAGDFAAPPAPVARPARAIVLPTPPPARPARPAAPSAHSGIATLSKGERAILTALAQYPAGRTKVQIAILTGYSHNGGGFNNYLSALRSREWIEGTGENLRITGIGLATLGDFSPLPTGADLLAHWLRNLGKCERAILSYLFQISPQAESKEELARVTGYEANGGGFNNALSKLRTLELITGRGEIRAADVFFE